jgi:FAS-associated factor 2
LYFIPGTQLEQLEASQRFKKEYENSYGPLHLNIFNGTFNGACSAAQTELKPLLVYLESSEHDDAAVFNQKILCDSALIQLLNDKFIVWAASSSTFEGSKVSDKLHVAGFPFVGVYTFVHNRLNSLLKLERLYSLDLTLKKIRAAGKAAEASLFQIKKEREAQLATQRLKQEQDRAFFESLRIDQQKEQQKKREEEKSKVKEEELFRENNLLAQARTRNLIKLPEEPEQHTPGAIELRIHFPNGSSSSRRFNESDKILHVYHFAAGELIEDGKCLIKNFSLCSSFPKKTFEDKSQTLKEVGFTPRMSLYLINEDD